MARSVTWLVANTQLLPTRAKRGTNVTNRMHESITLDDVQRLVTTACDGTRASHDLVEFVAERVVSSELVQHYQGRRVTDRDLAIQLASEVVPQILRFLADRAILIA